ncbi:MAG: hypothetical protein Q9162_006210 [Coniocarpon cinnabarinum]
MRAPWLLYALTVCVLCAAFFRHSIWDAPDPYKCNAALSTGTWLDPPIQSQATRSFQKWQPNGCMTQTYSGQKVARCLGNAPEQRAVFVGDSTVREVFWAVARALNTKSAAEAGTKAEKHADLDFSDGKVTLRFIWDPFLNSSDLSQHMSRSYLKTTENQDGSSGDLIVVGGGLWFAKDRSRPLDSFKDTVDALTAHLPAPDLVPGLSRKTMMLPVQPPYYDRLDKGHKPTMTPEKVNSMNAYLNEVALSHDISYLSSSLAMVEESGPAAYEPKGLHVMPQVADKQAEVILNLRCNALDREYPYDGTCCFQYHMEWAQLALLGAGLVLLAVVSIVEFQAWSSNSGQVFLDGVEKRQPILWYLLVMWLCLGYCFLADRTHLFNKLQKLYNTQDFFIFVGATTLIGFSTIKRSGVPSKSLTEKQAPADQPFLSRDQTDEWKGWMQALILAYHYTGASKVLWVYKLIRLMVASYLFMTGYGHAAYFYTKNDFSLKRLIAVNVRINLLSMLLPWFMGTDYLFYYFAPLVTYWYLIIYLTMCFKSSWNQQLPLFLAKTFIACSLTTLLHSQPWILDPVFKCINFVFAARWDAKEWMFRCQLDQFIVYVGMIVSVLYIRSSKPPPPPAPPQSSMATTSFTRPGTSPNLKNTAFFVASTAALLVYTYLTSTRVTKPSSNALHTFISPLPILAFIQLRNSSRTLRNHYSGAFAWLGRISLETFVLQYHLWLAADTKGLLSLGLFGAGGMSSSAMFGRGMGLGRWCDCLVLGVVFVWVSARVSDVTGALTGLVVKWMSAGK